VVAKALTTLQAAPAAAGVTMTTEAEVETKVFRPVVLTTKGDVAALTVEAVEAATIAAVVVASRANP
jgi:hypothetical protein